MTPFYKQKFFKHLVPFMLLMLGGSIGLREFTDLRYKYSRVTEVNAREELQKRGIKLKDPEEVTLEKQYEKLMKEADLDNWENVRIPRPWEEEEEKVE